MYKHSYYRGVSDALTLAGLVKTAAEVPVDVDDPTQVDAALPPINLLEEVLNTIPIQASQKISPDNKTRMTVGNDSEFDRPDVESFMNQNAGSTPDTNL